LDIFPSTQTVYGDNVVEVKRSITQFISCDSQIEKDFASAIDNDERTLLFVKLPDKFKVSTPIGGYNPDWAIVRLSKVGDPYLYLVRETKGSTIVRDLRFESEGWKIFFGMKHFNAIAVDFNIAKVASDLDIDVPLKDQFRFEFDTLTS
jgi:type III restriction enzyme